MAYQVQTETKPAMYSGAASPITSSGTGAGAAPTVAPSQQTKSSGDFVAPVIGAGLGYLAQGVLGSNPLGQLISNPSGALSKIGSAISGAVAPSPKTYYQDATGSIYTPDGYLWAAKVGNTYYKANSDGTWTNSDTGQTMTYSQMYQEITGTPMPNGNAVADYQPGDMYYPYEGYNPYTDYTPSDITTYYTPQNYSGDLSPWGQGSSADTSVYTPIDTTIGPKWYAEGGLATPMYASGGEVKSDGVHMASGGFLDSLLGTLSSGGVQGALVGTLLSQLLSSSSTGGGGATPLDMSKVGAIAPRTTSFGMGHPRYVTYGEYGQPTGDAGTQYNQLFGDLGVSGYAPRLSPLATSGKNPLGFADGGNVTGYYTFGDVIRPEDNLADGGRPLNTNIQMPQGQPLNSNVPMLSGRKDYRHGSYVEGAGDGQSDDIPAMLADGEYVMDAEIVSALGNGSNKAGAKVLDKMRENIRKHKRSGSLDSIPPKAKSPLSYMKGAK